MEPIPQPDTLHRVLDVLNALLPGGLLTAWCLWAVNWRKAWPVLASGGWIVLLLFGLMAAYTWSQIDARSLTLGGLEIANFTWKLRAVAILTVVGLFCGWLQIRSGWTPEDVNLDPPAGPADGPHHAHH